MEWLRKRGNPGNWLREDFLINLPCQMVLSQNRDPGGGIIG